MAIRVLQQPYSKSKLELNLKKNRNRVIKKIFVLFIFIFFLQIKPDSRYSSLSFVILNCGKTTDNLQLTGKISLKFDFSSSLHLEYGRKVKYHERT